jgi:hypothetical protein
MIIYAFTRPFGRFRFETVWSHDVLVIVTLIVMFPAVKHTFARQL